MGIAEALLYYERGLDKFGSVDQNLNYRWADIHPGGAFRLVYDSATGVTTYRQALIVSGAVVGQYV